MHCIKENTRSDAAELGLRQRAIRAAIAQVGNLVWCDARDGRFRRAGARVGVGGASRAIGVAGWLGSSWIHGAWCGPDTRLMTDDQERARSAPGVVLNSGSPRWCIWACAFPRFRPFGLRFTFRCGGSQERGFGAQTKGTECVLDRCFPGCQPL